MHTPGLTYPREWFEVTRYSKSPRPLQFQSETDKMLSTGTRRFKKVTDYARWYPTREEAEAAIAEIAGKNAAALAGQRIRDAAPELLEALTMYHAWSTCTPAELESRFPQWPRDEGVGYADKIARAAIAKAKGGAL